MCVNRRASDDPLGSGCGDRGDAVYAALKQHVARAGLVSRVWTTRTYCLGVCPKEGTAVAVSPGGVLLADVTASDVPALLEASGAKRS